MPRSNKDIRNIHKIHVQHFMSLEKEEENMVKY